MEQTRIGDRVSDSAAPLRVVHLSTFDSGGAGTAAHRLHRALRATGVESTMVVASASRGDPNVRAVTVNPGCPPIWESESERWRGLLSAYPNRPNGLELFSDANSPARLSEFSEIRDADIVHLHWVDGLFDYAEASRVLKGKPTVWTLHDMCPFTGGCHYAGECDKYLQGCGACPQLGSQLTNDWSHSIWKKKLAACRKLAPYVVSPSRWLRECASRSAIFSKCASSVIPNGLPLDIFRPQEKERVRNMLGVSSTAKVILFGANYDTARKGGRYAIEALVRLSARRDDVMLMVFGPQLSGMEKSLQIPIRNCGHLDDESALAAVYNCADVFLLPSLEDNLPNTMLEALACGVPVVGFATGGIVDMVEDGKTGRLVEPRDIDGLVSAIEWCLNHSGMLETAQYCRKKMEAQCSFERQASSYTQLYESIRNGRFNH